MDMNHWMNWTYHPLADRDRMMTEPERLKLEAFIRLGYDESNPIVMFEGKILDGRNRWKCCVIIGIQPPSREFGSLASDGTDPEAFLDRVNGPGRRHLSQAELIAREASRVITTHGGARTNFKTENSDLNREEEFSFSDAAKSSGVSPDTIAFRKKVDDHGCLDLIAAVNDEVVSVSDAAKIAKKPEAVQKAAVAAVKAKQHKTLAAATNAIEAASAPFGEEPEPDDVEQTIEEIIAEKNSDIEKFCRSLIKFAEENMPSNDPWLHDGNRRAGAMQKVKDACAMLRTCKCHAPCPHENCGPDGCEYCLNTRRVTKYKFDMMV